MYMDGTLDERYQSAVNSQDLTARSDGRSDVDSIVAVAWSRSHLGAALLRLHSQWDGAARRGLVPEQRFHQLKALPEVRKALLGWADARRGAEPEMEASEDVVAAVLAWWLDKACKGCNGTGWVSRANRPPAPCTTCHGSKEARIPHGVHGRAAVAYMETCIYRARASIRGRLKR